MLGSASEVLHQSILEKAVQTAFPNANIVVNARKHSSVHNPQTGHFFEVDVYLPHLSLGFEYQDEYHYSTTWYSNVSLANIQSNDNIKTELVNKLGVTLIHVPCWWDSNPDSLISSISFQRPDVIDPSPSPPIPLNPPSSFFINSYFVPDLGEVMLASFVVPPSKFADSISISQPWWVGEKYDGIRCIWNSTTKQMYSRRGRLVDVSHPSLFSLPSFVDAELWHGRGRYSESQDLIFSENSVWNNNLRLIAFDDPSPNKLHLPFEKRYTHLLRNITFSHPFITIASRFLCNSLKKLEDLLQMILVHKGEGLILRKPKSLYEHGRSSNLVKLKASQTDAEALVTAVSKSVISLQFPNESTIEVPNDKSAFSHLKPGDVVTVEYEIYSRRPSPVSPKISRVRSDMTWRDVVRDYNRDTRLKQDSVLGFATKPARFWTVEKGKNLKKALEDFAVNQNMDPSLPSTWYNMPRQLLLDHNVVHSSVFSKGGGYPKVMAKLFPNLHLDETKFILYPSGYWSNVNNRKLFFENFARKHKFDPLVAENWYSVNSRQIRAMKGSGLLNHYENSFIKALIHLYPNLSLERYRFSVHPQNYWKDVNNQIAFYSSFARENKFDPLVADNWYKFAKDLHKKKGASSLKLFLGKSLRSYLPSIFPNIGLEENKLLILPARYWKSKENQKLFFDAYAANHNFDPLEPHNWYSVSNVDIENTKKGKSLLFYHQYNVARALTHSYPNIGLDVTLFQPKKMQFKDFEKRKSFFDSYALHQGFDPLVPENWYPIKANQIMNIRHVIAHSEGSLVKALQNVYPSVFFDKDKFNWPQDPYRHWKKIENRKNFFDEFAKERGVDPLLPQSWYSVTRAQLRTKKHAAAVLSYYGDKFTVALEDVYPNIGLQKEFFVGFKKMRKRTKD